MSESYPPSKEKLTYKEAVGLFGGNEAVFNQIVSLSDHEPIRLMNEAHLVIDDVDGQPTYEIWGTPDQIRFAWDHHGGRQRFQ